MCTRDVPDSWAWYPDKKGIFSVSSVYKMMISTKIEREGWLEGRGGPSETSTEEKAWSSLWQLQVPSKICVLIWRLARHSLPTTDVLHKRNMVVQDACPLCGGEDSWRHALVSCTMARCTWALSEEVIVV